MKVARAGGTHCSLLLLTLDIVDGILSPLFSFFLLADDIVSQKAIDQLSSICNKNSVSDKRMGLDIRQSGEKSCLLLHSFGNFIE